MTALSEASVLDPARRRPRRAQGTPALPGLPTAAVARTQLAGLKVAGQQPMTGYSRAKFTHWTGQGDACDTREVVLERSGRDVKRDAECKAVSGTWVSVYDGVTITDAGKLDVEHMVPLANAWRSGAGAWTADRRKEFANDLIRPQLLAVSGRRRTGPREIRALMSGSRWRRRIGVRTRRRGRT
ncbi:hypothetical protein ACFRJ1_05275 [Streptomyces sp. NPDC056773]|uniref:hypothetical protein n=1 Tax=unclassified Streptomyces TaxID=2593676 RepID=UPI0036ABE354